MPSSASPRRRHRSGMCVATYAREQHTTCESNVCTCAGAEGPLSKNVDTYICSSSKCDPRYAHACACIRSIWARRLECCCRGDESSPPSMGQNVDRISVVLQFFCICPFLQRYRSAAMRSSTCRKTMKSKIYAVCCMFSSHVKAKNTHARL